MCALFTKTNCQQQIKNEMYRVGTILLLGMGGRAAVLRDLSIHIAIFSLKHIAAI